MFYTWLTWVKTNCSHLPYGLYTAGLRMGEVV